ncbi:MAG: hypothetical protein GC189_13885 [Alphaproteobacteria bacterium]|nr:hypothetical protein [Alphaproteobacteria bacterium]
MKARVLKFAAAAAMLGWLAACGQTTEETAADAESVTEQVGEAASEAGAAVEGAAEDAAGAAAAAGEAVEGAANDAATAVDHATDDDPNT